MSSHFEARRIDALPTLAWLLDATSGAQPTVHHGPGVLIRDHGFFEGAWCGDFHEFAFHEATNVLGSGVRFDEEGMTLVPPSHTQECLYISSRPSGTTVSNSLAFLLTYLGDSLRLDDWSYGERFARILNGVPDEPDEIATTEGRVKLLFHHNGRIDTAGQLEVRPKPLPPHFADYAGYVGYLRHEVQALTQNAGAPARPVRFEPLCTISSGYDSTAVAVLAAEAGCREAVSFRTARSGDEDSGEVAAQVLGLTSQCVERIESTANDPQAEIEFLSSGMQGEDVFMTSLADLVPGRILFSGFVGGAAWTPHTRRTDPLARNDLSGAALGEFRIRTGFVHFPVPTTGLPHSPELDLIAQSQEMQPYHVDGGYNRPLPRRIAEQAGIPRACFGTAKNAASVHLFLDPSLWSPEATAAVESRRASLGPRGRLGYRLWAFRFGASRSFRRWASRLQRLFGGPRGVSDDSLAGRLFARIFGERNAIVEHSHPRNTLLQHWALGALRERYSPAGNAR